MNSTFKQILQLTRTLSYADKKGHTLIVYFGGHGASDRESQLYLLNSDDSKKAIFPIETKLMYLNKDETSLLKIFAIYDCCRVDVKYMPGLSGKQRGDGVALEDDPKELEVCNYFHIQACPPGGVADADSGFAKKILDRAIKMS